MNMLLGFDLLLSRGASLLGRPEGVMPFVALAAWLVPTRAV